MTHFDSLPLWISIPVAAFVIIGATITLIGAIGFLRLDNFYDRLHAPTLGTSWGSAGIILGSMLLNSHLEGRAVIHEIVLIVFVTLTTPVTLILLGRAALQRDRIEGKEGLPEEMRSSEEARET